MRHAHWLSALLFAATFAVVTLAPSTASAVPCCSAPICQRDEPPPICGICSDCALDDALVDELAVDEVVYDDYEDDVCVLGEAE